MVIVPSLSFEQDDLRLIAGVRSYEERLLFLLLTLRQPGLKVVYLSTDPVDESIVDYYLGFLDDPEGARTRLHMISTEDPLFRPLTCSVLARADLLDRLREIVGDGSDAWLMPAVVSEHEERLAAALSIPFYGSPAALARLGSKTGSRMVAEEAGVPLARGFADLRSLAATERAARTLRTGGRLIVKLNDSYAGLGNAIVEMSNGLPLARSRTSFSYAGETWTSFAEKISERGAVIEEYIEQRPLHHPSALGRISPGGHYDVMATHDQILGGANADAYRGCTFPARPEYRRQVSTCAGRISRVLAEHGVIGLFSMDFFVLGTEGGYGTLLCEINLRTGGTTHPFGAALLATGASYDPATGTLVHGDQPKYYTATDNCASPALYGRTPAQVVRQVERLGLGFDQAGRTGNVLHLLGAVPRYGKLGLTSIANSPEEAAELHRATVSVLGG
ncbi:peptide ligase PGM1-related protein [Streptosporangium soli]|nr:peptide ligase PGM1-related protein [Streptosporangium sp. KLBMP 9127]